MATSKKNTFDSWVATQNETVENLVETGKKLQDSATKGTVMKEGADIYKAWLEKQKDIMNKTFSAEFVKNMELPNMPQIPGMPSMEDYMKTMVEAQTKLFNDKWLEQYKEMVQKAGGSFGSMKSLEEMAKMQPEDMMKEMRKAYDQWSAIYHDWINQSSKGFEGIKGFLDGKGGGTVADMMNTSQVYMKMYEVWKPMMENMKSQIDKMSKDTGMDMEWAKSAFNTEAYKEAIDRVFKFSSPEKFKEFYEQMQKFTQDYYGQAKSAQSKLNEQFNAFSKEMASHTNPKWSGMVHDLNAQMEKLVGPFKKMMPNGKEKEAIDTAMEVQEKLSVYWSKYNELQYMVYTASQRAFDLVAQDMMEKMQSGQPTGNFNDFFNNWLNVTEKSVSETFGTDDFSKTQGELLTTGLEIKKELEKQMEGMLSVYPVVSRSEADEMAQIIHDLKSRVRSLEKKLAEGKEEEEAAPAKKAPVKKTTAAAK